MEKAKLEEYKTILLNLRSEILAQFEKDKHASSSEVLTETGDEMDLASEQSFREFYHIMGERDRIKLNQIQNALQKIDTGEFGLCEECGEEIGEKRLRAVPYATLCVDCKEKQEAEVKQQPDRGLDFSSGSSLDDDH